MSKPRIALVMTTMPRKGAAKKLAKALLKARLVACVNVLSGVSSHYWWKGRLEVSKEVLMVMKTSSRLAPKALKAIKSQHPYDVPEILILPVAAAHPAYESWLLREVQSA